MRTPPLSLASAIYRLWAITQQQHVQPSTQTSDSFQASACVLIRR